MSKRVSYKNLLKEAIAEFDTSKTVDVKGPMLDPILKWDGQGELPIMKDAASILERYYYNETADKGVEINESENEDGTEKRSPAEQDAKGTGTEQAGTGAGATIKTNRAEKEKMIAKEQDEELGADVEEEELEEEANDKKLEKQEKNADEEEAFTEDIENAVLEKLIAEMEEENDDEEEDLEEADVMTYTKEGPKTEAPKEKKASGPEQDAQGAGTAQAGTGIDDGQVPDRKDIADKFVKAKNYNEQEEADADEDDEEELDIDKEVKEAAASPMPGGLKGEDADEDVYEEAFQLFQEAIEDDDDDDDDDDDNDNDNDEMEEEDED